ncbi:hypothetical protein P22_1458 [Propionispora sp. 2/2-37]|uniref:ABC transporter ATP-binding protein n=1 Tax=Propionispora sp. 2/2-37 TaxID=1677858 RepID=UPI0006BB6712|nr:ABC transporter ATP-binding protein [Propionispora sp. 2/2-37]CUH95388.1 hypothetical protein P22_1458 [Propionispora sp. 2/2-37]
MKVTVEGVSLQLGDKQVLQDISFQVNKREFIGIIGPNGSGKSTLLKCIYNVLKPDAGIITVDDLYLKDLKLKEAALRLAVVGQHNSYDFEFSVEDIVLMGRAPYKKMLDSDTAADYEIVKNSLALVGMTGMEKRNFSTLSGGEQQRVIVARALTQQTKCLILDEPTNHLDIKYQLQLMEMIKKLHCTVMAAIHDLNIAALYCDRLLAIEEGRIITMGTVEDVLTPEFINSLFGVKARIVNDRENNQFHVLYQRP